MLNELQRVHDYFNREAEDYDAYFSQGRQPRSVGRCLAKHLLSRRAPYQRMNAVIDLCGSEVAGRTILEVGCGPGRYALALARRGAKLTGIDFAPNMISIAQKLAAQEGLEGCCRFVVGDILDYCFEEVFDISFAAGVLDYTPRDQQVALLRRMDDLSTQAVIVSFPKRWHYHAFLRKGWLWAKGVPVYFYSQADIQRLFAAAGLREVESRDIGILTVKKAVAVR